MYLTKMVRVFRNLGEKGFSLIELLVVLVIISLLVALVAPKFLGHVDTAKQQDAQAQI